MYGKLSPSESEKVAASGKAIFGVHQAVDPGVSLVALFGSKALLGGAILASSILPRYLAALAGGLILVSAYRNAVNFSLKKFLFPPKPQAKPTKEEQRHINLDVNSTEPINFRVAPVIEGDFVVFLIGARVNDFSRNTGGNWIGDAMSAMLKELQDAPELGCLNADSYVTTNPVGGSTFLLIQYWRSYEQLADYARGKDNEHYPAWMRIIKHAREGGAQAGIWHETFKVRAGEYEGIYINTPPFGLGKVGLVPAVGHMATSKGRAGMTDGTDYLEGTEENYDKLNKIDLKISQKCPMSGAQEGTCPVAH